MSASKGFILPSWIDSDAWEAYEEMRNRAKKPMSDYARRLAVLKLIELEKQGHKSTEVLNQSIFLCYQGLFPLKNTTAGFQAPPVQKLKETEFKL